MVVLKELIVSQFPLLGGCSGLERTDCKQFLLWEGVVLLQELNFSQFPLLGGCGGNLERTDFLTVSTLGRVWWS